MVLMVPKLVAADGMKFVVRPIMPKTQIIKNVNYYDLLLRPGQKQNVTFRLTNHTDEDVDVDVNSGQATTSDGGMVDYAAVNGNVDASLKQNMTDLLTFKTQRVHLVARKSQNVTVLVKMPDTPIDGEMAGGVRFHQVNTEAKAKTKGFQLTNELSYVIAIVARQKMTLPEPNLELLGVRASQLDAQNIVAVNLQNNQATFMKRLEVVAKIKNQQGKTVYHAKKNMMQMAPNSNFNFPVRLSGKAFVAGTYTADITGYYTENAQGKYVDAAGTHFKYRKHFTKVFKITKDDATKMNKKDGLVVANSHWPLWVWLLLFLLAIILGLILFIFWFIFGRRKKDKEEDAGVQG